MVWKNSLALKTLTSTTYNDRFQIGKKENGETGEALGKELRNTGVVNECWSHCQWCLVTRPHHVAGKLTCGLPHCMATQLPYMDFLLCPRRHKKGLLSWVRCNSVNMRRSSVWCRREVGKYTWSLSKQVIPWVESMCGFIYVLRIRFSKGRHRAQSQKFLLCKHEHLCSIPRAGTHSLVLGHTLVAPALGMKTGGSLAHLLS